MFFRELSCDDLTVDAIGDPLPLASALIKVWEHHRSRSGLDAFPTASRIALIGNGDLERRIRRLIAYRRPRMKFVLGRLARGAGVILLFVLLVAAWTFAPQRDDRVQFHSGSEEVACSIYVRAT